MTHWLAAWAKTRFGRGLAEFRRVAFGSLCGLSLLDCLAIQRDEVDVVEIERRETTVASHVRHDATHKRESHARTLDQKERVQLIVRDVVDLEDARVFQFEHEERFFAVLVFGRDVVLGDHLVLAFAALAGVERHLNLNVGLNFAFDWFLRQNVFKRQIADELSEDLHLRRCRCCWCGAVFVLGHGILRLTVFQIEPPLTEGHATLNGASIRTALLGVGRRGLRIRRRLRRHLEADVDCRRIRSFER